MNGRILDFLDKRVLFVTGKGGVGKSTVSIALGIRAAMEGKRAIVVEVSSTENASRIFRQSDVGFKEVEMSNDLWAISIDPEDSMREYVLLQLKVKAMRDLLFRSRMFTYLAAATPGLNELVTIGKIWELAQLDRKVKHGRKYDLVIVDLPATGHGISFLQSPRTFANIARMGPIHTQARQLQAMINDHDHSGTVIVSLPEEMPVNETRNLEEQLTDDVNVAVDRVIMNGLNEESFSGADLKEIKRLRKSDDPEVRAAGKAAISQCSRTESQMEQLERLEGLVKAPITTLPFIFKPEIDLSCARKLAEEIA
ncbi:MAG: ArsA family ATPase [Solirubrobacterales bacterium]|nr:ArsA family ATPase [Solirubrobacterales bacterium]